MCCYFFFLDSVHNYKLYTNKKEKMLRWIYHLKNGMNKQYRPQLVSRNEILKS